MTGDADLLGGETENEGPFVGMQGPLERGEWKSTVILPTWFSSFEGIAFFGCLGVPGLFSWIEKNFCMKLLN